MIRGQGERLTQLGAPDFERLARACIDQVEGKARENRPGRFQGRDRLRGRMLPTEHMQRRRIEALHADRDAIYPGIAKRREPTGFDAGRVGLEGDLDVVGWLEQVPRVVDQHGDRVRLHQAGGAAAEEDRGQPASGRGAPPPRPVRGAARSGSGIAGCAPARGN